MKTIEIPAGAAGLRRAEGMGPIHARGILSELRKRFGKRYTVRKVDGKSVRVFAGVRLIDAAACPLRCDCFRSIGLHGL